MSTDDKRRADVEDMATLKPAPLSVTSSFPPGEAPTTLAEVRESVELAWTDATHLPESPEQEMLCTHLHFCAELVDRMIEGAGK